MPGGKRDLSIPWPLHPAYVDSNEDTGLLKLVAMLTMLIDHMGARLFPGTPIMRIIGRMAFPIYAYCLAVGCVRTRDPVKYLSRIIVLALISQPLYAVAMNHTVKAMYNISFAEKPLAAALNFYVMSWTGKPSILASLSLGLVLIEALREKRIACALGVFLLVYLLRRKLDYGERGVILMVLFYAFIEHRWVSLLCVSAFLVVWGHSSTGYELFGFKFGLEMFAILALPLIYSRTHTKIRIPKWLGYGFYPAHLILIYILDKFVF